MNARERGVALEVGHGRSNAEIAGRPHISVPTVKTRVSSVLLVHDAGWLD